MSAKQVPGRGIRRGVPAALLAGALTVAALGGGAGPAAATQHRAAAAAGPAVAGDISTIAGGPGGPGRGTNVSTGYPCGVSYSDGAVYIAGEQSVQRLNSSTGWLTTLAGTGANGPVGNGGPAAAASFGQACDVARDQHGNLVVADGNNEQIRVVAHRTGWAYHRHMTAGDIYVVAGTGRTGYSPSGGLASKTRFSDPDGVAIDSAGNLVISDAFNYRIRVLAEQTGTFYGQSMTAGHIYTVAGNGTRGYSGDGGPATSAELNQPTGVALDPAGNLIITDNFNSRIRVVAKETGTFYGQQMTAGDIYTVAGNGTRGYSGDGGPATAAEFDGPWRVAVDGAGNLVVADLLNARVRVVAGQTGMFYGRPMTAGDVYTVGGNGQSRFSGDGGKATAAEFAGPGSVALDAAGNMLLCDHGSIRVVAGQTGTFYGRAMTAGDVYNIAGDGQVGQSGPGRLATHSKISPAGVALDASGNVLFASGSRILVMPDSSGTFYGQPMTAGHLYDLAGTGRSGHHGLNGPATAAELADPGDVAVDPAGNVLIADTGSSQIRIIAEHTGTFYGEAMTAGDIYKIAGTRRDGYSGTGHPANQSRLAFPASVAVDATGNVLIADTENQRIRVVAEQTGTFYGQPMTAGDLYTIAGDDTAGGYAGDGGPATAARLNWPGEVAVDAAGNVLISDTRNNRVRVLAEQTGTFYGVPMTAGDIYTVAGTGTDAFSGDGGPATSAELGDPSGLVASPAGDLIFGDPSSGRVREVSG